MHINTHTSLSLPRSLLLSHPGQAHSHIHAHGRTWPGMHLRHSPDPEVGEHMLSASPGQAAFQHICLCEAVGIPTRGCFHSLSPRIESEWEEAAIHREETNPLSTWGCNADEFHVFVRNLFFFRRKGRLSDRPSFWEAD